MPGLTDSLCRLFTIRRNFTLRVPSPRRLFGSFGPPVHPTSSLFINQTTIRSLTPQGPVLPPSHTMGQLTSSFLLLLFHSQERDPLVVDYPTQQDPMSRDSSPSVTVAPSVTSGFPDEDTSTYDPTVPIPSSLSVSQSQPTQVCDSNLAGSSFVMEQHTIQTEPSILTEGRRWNEAPSHPTSAPDSELGILAPFPGLTKNSQGTSVPEKAEEVFEDGPWPFPCPLTYCDWEFNQGKHLARHLDVVHTEYTRKTPSSRFLASRS